MSTIRSLRSKEKHPLRLLLPVLIFGIAVGTTFPQETRPSAAPGPLSESRALEAEARLRLAISSLDYPVTPGDIYRLTYYQTADTIVTNDVLVDGNSAIDLGIFGRIEAAGITFAELKHRVENLIAQSYARSLPSLRIVSPGVFGVAVSGEVDQAQSLAAWGLTRLSDVVTRGRGRYSSLRRVEVVSRNGITGRYDLLAAMRGGDATQDPYVKPGDSIVLYAQQRTITLSGEVRHPGQYELLAGEGLSELIERFGGGLTASADKKRVRIERVLVSRPTAEYVTLPDAYQQQIELSDGDAVIVPSRTDRIAVVWFEGAVAPQGAQTSQATARPTTETVPSDRPTLSRFSHPIREGEMLSDALVEAQQAILPTADLRSSTLRHEGETSTVFVDLSSLLAESHSPSDVALRPNDTIFIPALPSTVSVYGAVMSPGFFPYQSGFPISYYLSLAGGIDPERNTNGEYWVTDPNGKRRPRSEAVMPGDQIYVPLNSFGYRFERSAPLAIAIVSAAINAATFIFLFLISR